MSEHVGAVVRALSLVVLLLPSACSIPTPGSRAAAKDRPASSSASHDEADAAVGARCPRVQPTTVEGRIADAEIDELSGIVASHVNPGVYWVHNDSGDDARAFAIDSHGRTVAELSLTNVAAYDLEDIALVRGQAGAADVLVLADIGDNWKHRDSVKLIFVEEPRLVGQPAGLTIRAPARTLELVYDDGKHDAETVLIDPSTNDLFVVAKSHNVLSEELVGVYRVPATELRAALARPKADSSVGRTVARKVAAIALGATTAGDIAPDGSAIIVRSYWSAKYWPRAPGETVAQALAKPGCRLPVSDRGKQGESLAFSSDGTAYVTVAEGHHPAVLRYAFAR